jgi:hypothetical protein
MNANDIAEELESIHWLQDGAKTKPFQMYADFIRQQQAEIEELRKFKAEIDAENKKLFEAVQKANAMWDRATGVQE